MAMVTCFLSGLQLPSAALIRRGSASSEVFASLASLSTLPPGGLAEASAGPGGGGGGGGTVVMGGGGRMSRPTLLFDVPELFLFGTPLAVVLLYRQMIPGNR